MMKIPRYYPQSLFHWLPHRYLLLLLHGKIFDSHLQHWDFWLVGPICVCCTKSKKKSKQEKRYVNVTLSYKTNTFIKRYSFIFSFIHTRIHTRVLRILLHNVLMHECLWFWFLFQFVFCVSWVMGNVCVVVVVVGVIVAAGVQGPLMCVSVNSFFLLLSTHLKTYKHTHTHTHTHKHTHPYKLS